MDDKNTQEAYELFTLDYIAHEEEDKQYYKHVVGTVLIGGGLFYMIYKFNSDNILEAGGFTSGNY